VLPLLAALSLVTAGAPPPSVGGVPWRPTPPPWVTSTPIPTPTLRANPAAIETLLLDDQVRVVSGAPERFQRRVRRIGTSAGLEEGVDVMVEWRPAWESLTMHWVRVRRGDQVLEPVSPRHVRVLQRERDLESGMLHDGFTLAIFVPGLQVGDVVDVAFTRGGQNPALGDRYADWFDLAWPEHPVVQRTLRVVWRGAPVGGGRRPLHVRPLGGAPEPEREETRWGLEHRWSVVGAELPRLEPYTPSWWVEAPAVQLSDFDTWADVAAWDLPAYQVPEALSPEMQAWLSGVDGADDEARFLAAAAFVRGQVRYLGFEVGENSLRPHPPEQVFEQRYGDCKDTALLLVTLLHHLGIEAAPALVGTGWGTHVSDLQPSPFAFDHVIVRAEVGGAVRWVDTTMPHEEGPYADWTPVGPYEVLVVRPGAAALERVEPPPPTTPEEEVQERFQMRATPDGAALTVRSVLRRGRAHELRRRLAEVGQAGVAEAYLEFQRERLPRVEVAAPLSVADRGTEVEVTESYVLPGQVDQDLRVGGWAVDAVLPELGSDGPRVAPMALPEPAWVRHTVELRSPVDLGPHADDARVEVQGLRFSYRERSDETHAVISYEVQLTGDDLPAAEVAAYVAAVERARDEVSRTWHWRTGGGPRPSGGGAADLTPFGVGLVVLLLVGIPWLLSWPKRALLAWRRGTFARKHNTLRGETAQAPLRVERREALEAAMRRRRCPCGTPSSWGPLGEASELRMGDRVVWSCQAECRACGRAEHIYFVR
jgi:hypothetical protein